MPCIKITNVCILQLDLACKILRSKSRGFALHKVTHRLGRPYSLVGKFNSMNTENQAITSKVPEITLVFWITKFLATTLGTALGDWTADTAGLGYIGGTILFSSMLAVVAAAYYWTKISPTLLFWAAFILTRPLGAVVGDFLDKPLETRAAWN